MHIVLGLWNAHRDFKEEESREQKKQEQSQNVPNMPSVSSIMGQASRMGSNIKMPNMNSFKP
jgi:hypothetical protein